MNTNLQIVVNLWLNDKWHDFVAEKCFQMWIMIYEVLFYIDYVYDKNHNIVVIHLGCVYKKIVI